MRRAAGRLAAFVAALAAVGFLGLQAWYLAHIVWWISNDPVESRFMAVESERLRAAGQRGIVHTWVEYERIAESLKRAVIAAEDARFAEHHGIDWGAIQRAFFDNLESGRIVRGGSTISMQLAKNLFLTGERTYLRKAQEVLITWMLEAVLSKERILEIYLNVAQWGGRVFGAEAAAQRYFGVSAQALTDAQAARMAAMLPRPAFYDRNRDSPALDRRAAFVSRHMGSVTLP